MTIIEKGNFKVKQKFTESNTFMGVILRICYIYLHLSKVNKNEYFRGACSKTWEP